MFGFFLCLSCMSFVLRRNYHGDRTQAQAPVSPSLEPAPQAGELSGYVKTGVCGDKLCCGSPSKNRLRFFFPSAVSRELGFVTKEGNPLRCPPSAGALTPLHLVVSEISWGSQCASAWLCQLPGECPEGPLPITGICPPAFLTR